MAHNLSFEVCLTADFKIEVSTSIQCYSTGPKITNGLQKDSINLERIDLSAAHEYNGPGATQV